jgi:hypothetical protein
MHITLASRIVYNIVNLLIFFSTYGLDSISWSYYFCRLPLITSKINSMDHIHSKVEITRQLVIAKQKIIAIMVAYNCK